MEISLVDGGSHYEVSPVFTYNTIGHQLPHLQVLEQVGCNLGKLFVSILVEYKLVGIMKSGNKASIKKGRGFFMDHILKHCPN